MNAAPNARETLAQEPAEILSVLPQMGRVMLIARSGGATHERIGAVEAVSVRGTVARVTGKAHDSLLDTSAIAHVVADRTGRMREKSLPRLECQNVAGETLCSAIALDGPELFEQALARFGTGEALAPVEDQAQGEWGGVTEVPPDDLGIATFAAIRDTGEAIAIELRKPGLVQAWRGLLPSPKLAMGFVNLMQDDFHFHLKAGAVARWRRGTGAGKVELHGEDSDGIAYGLVLVGTAAAFANVPSVSGNG